MLLHFCAIASQKFHAIRNNNKIMVHKNNLLKYDTSRLRNSTIQVVGEENSIGIGDLTKISDLKITVLGCGNKLVIGNECSIKGGEIYFWGHNCQITIADKTSIISACISVLEERNSIEIGQDCMFAWGIDIRCGDGHPILDLATGRRLNSTKNIIIGKHVWLAANVQVLKGVSIGNNCIVGARAVVTKNIPANSLAVGVPAKVIKNNVTWDRE
jgi:acetyltransferase-like isoleucine patch superfamily enzyme